MQVDWNERICGFTMIEVRDLARKLFYGHDIEFIAAATALTPADANALVAQMLARGWLDQPQPGVYETTIAGNAFAMAKKLAPISRAKAEELLRKVIDETHAINADPTMAYDVTYLAVFGSYLGDAAVLGDLDIAFAAKGRWPDADTVAQDTAFRAAHERCHAAHPSPANGSVPHYLWPWVLVKRRLRVSHRVSLHERAEIDRLGWKQRIIIDGGADAAQTHGAISICP